VNGKIGKILKEAGLVKYGGIEENQGILQSE
jgi:hypothetical protein